MSAKLFVVCMPMLVLIACGENNTYVPPPPPKVIVALPLQQTVTPYLELTGNTQAINTVDLEARVPGFLDKVNYKDGSLVKKGDLLFTIQRDTYEAQLAQAKANLALSQASSTNAQIQYNRHATLAKERSPAFSQAVFDDVKAKRDETAAQVAAAKANLESATINLSYTEIAAPYDGIVTRHLVDVGALVGNAGPTTLATIIQVQPIYAYFNVSESTVLRIRKARAKRGRTRGNVHEVPVELGLHAEKGYPHKGRIDYVAPQVDPDTGTLEVRAVFDNKDLVLMPGLFVRVRVPEQLQRVENALLVEETAIGTSQLGEYVLVVGKDDVVEQRPVKIGQLDGGLRVIESGLSADDWVIISGIQRAIPGNRVDPDRQEITVPVAEASPQSTAAVLTEGASATAASVVKVDIRSATLPIPNPRRRP